MTKDEVIKPHDHPDFVGGWVWTPLEMRWIEQRVAAAVAAEHASMMQLFTDPENQPTQHGTVTVEYMQSEIAAEREACARICETEWSTTQEHVHGLALADMIRDRAKP